MRNKEWLLNVAGVAAACCIGAQMLSMQTLTVHAETKESRSDGIEITWEDDGKTRGYISKIPSSFSGNNGTWTVPDGVYKIEDEAFEGGKNERVKQIMLPASFETKEYSASGDGVHDSFDLFTNLTDIDVHADNKNFAALNGVLYSADHRTIIEYPIGRTSIELGTASNGENPNPTRIGKWAFSGLNLKDFTLPGSVTDYEEHALTGLSGVDRMVLPSSPAMLKSYTFENTGFKEIIVPNNTSGKSIGANWIVTDHDVTVTIPDTVTSIDDNAIVLNNNAKAVIKAPKDSAAENIVKKLNNSNITFEETASASSSSATNASTNSSPGGKTAQINNQVTNMDNKNKVSAKVNGGSSSDEYTLLIKDSAGNNLKKIITLDSNTSLIAYDLSLVDKDGKEVKDFTSVEVTLPVPSNMDRTKGTIDVVTINSQGNLEQLRTSVKQDGDAVTASFTTNHFTEFGIRYVQASSATAATSAASASTSAATGTSTGSVNGSGTGAGTGTANRSSGSDVPRTGDSEAYPIMLMTMGALMVTMALVMMMTRGAKRRAR